MQEVTARSARPFSAICHVQVTWPDGSSTTGSGTLVGPNDVLTALHMVFNAERGGWAAGIVVTPGADMAPSFDRPYGSFSDFGTLEGRVPNWDLDGDGLLVPTESQNDLAVIGFHSRLGDVAGWLPVVNQPTSLHGLMLGYPAEGTGLMGEEAHAVASSQYGVYRVASGLGPGASGGPLLYDVDGQSHLAGVLSAGDGNRTTSVYAGLFGGDTLAWLNAAVQANDTLLLAPAPVVGTSANDRLAGTSLRNSVDGGEGVDTYVIGGARGDYIVNTSTGLAVVDNAGGASRGGTDTLVNVERLQFNDVSVALDISGMAGFVVKLIGAVLGPASVSDRATVGAGLALADAGMSAVDLASLALEAKLGSQAGDPASVIHLLYRNLTGAPPDNDQLAFFTAALESGQWTAATLCLLAADEPVNQLNIGLAGLASGGVEYVPLATG